VSEPIVAALHLFGVEGLGVARAFTRMALERGPLKRSDGIKFWKLLGTGDGQTFTPQDADPHLWGMFTVWKSVDRLRAFESESPVMRRWTSLSVEQCSLELRPIRWKGSWSGQTPFEGSVPDPTWDGPVAALTRARIRPSQWRSFWSAVPPVAADAVKSPGLRFSVGIGEAPLGLQATFSLWDSSTAIDQFAYRGAPHRQVIRRTHSTNWYAEEMFARFAVTNSRGTVKGESI
jgi:hypothetical protein